MTNNNNSVTDNFLFILLLNANSLRNHAHKLEIVLNNKRIDISLISETNFTIYSQTYIPGYNLINTNHPVIRHTAAWLYMLSLLFLTNLCLVFPKTFVNLVQFKYN